MEKSIFKGIINGKEFTDVEEFNKYLNEVIDEPNLSVSKSFETVKSDNEPEKENPVKQEEKKNALDLNRLKIDSSAQTFFGKYPQSYDLIYDIINCDNKDEVKKELSRLLDEEDSVLKENEQKSDDINKEIGSLRASINKLREDLDEVNSKSNRSRAKKVYYKELLNSVDVDFTNKHPHLTRDLFDLHWLDRMLMF